jgi:hypothetical protein
MYTCVCRRSPFDDTDDPVVVALYRRSTCTRHMPRWRRWRSTAQPATFPSWSSSRRRIETAGMFGCVPCWVFRASLACEVVAGGVRTCLRVSTCVFDALTRVVV